MKALRILSVLAMVFGLLTVKEGGSVIFDVGHARQRAGHYVPFVLWVNFLSGFLYTAAGVGLWMRKRWAVVLSMVLTITIGITFVAFGIRILQGADYEMRTVYAMTLRGVVWLVISGVSYRQIVQR